MKVPYGSWATCVGYHCSSKDGRVTMQKQSKIQTPNLILTFELKILRTLKRYKVQTRSLTLELLTLKQLVSSGYGQNMSYVGLNYFVVSTSFIDGQTGRHCETVYPNNLESKGYYSRFSNYTPGAGSTWTKRGTSEERCSWSHTCTAKR